MSAQDSFDLVTDAVPDRRNSITLNTTNVNAQEDFNKHTLHCDEEVTSTNTKRSPFKGFTKLKKVRIPTAQATIININNSNGIQVGDTTVYNVSNDRSEYTFTKIKETDAIKNLKKSQAPLQRDDLLFIAKHMNKSWRDTFRKLNFSDGEIEQCYLNHYHLEIKEVIFQLLRRWSENKFEEATIGELCSILWDNNQQEVVEKFSERKN